MGRDTEAALKPDASREAGSGTFDAWFSPSRFALLLGLCIVVSFPTVIFGSQSFVARDFGLFSYPAAFYQRECFWRGELPLWNPLHNCGIPFLAQFNTMALYPLDLFYLLLPLNWSLSVFSLLHLLIAGLGMYYLCERWTGSRFAAALAGMAFAFNGVSLNLLMWPSHVATYAWMPWVIWAVEPAWKHGGRHIVTAALCGAMQMLGGGPETILLTWLIALALWLGQWISERGNRLAMIRRFALVVALVAGLAAAQLLPFLDLVAHAQRSTGYAGSGWSMPARGWANFFVPLFGTIHLRKGIYMQENQYWTSSYYVGIAVTVLAALAVWRVRRRRVWFLAALAIAGTILAMGDNIIVFRILKRLIPALGFMNHPVKFAFLPVFALPLLAGFAVVELQRLAQAAPEKARRLLPGFGTAAALLVGVLVFYSRVHPADQEVWADTVMNALTRVALLAAALSALFFWCRLSDDRTRQLLVFAVVILAWVDVFTHAPDQNPTANRAVYQPGLVQLTPQPRLGESRVFVSFAAIDQMLHGTSGDVQKDFLLFRQGLFLDSNLLDGIPTIGGFYSLYVKSDLPIRGLLGARRDRGPDPLADFAGIAWESDPKDVFSFVPRTNFLPLITAGQKPLFADASNTLAAIGAPEFRPREAVYLPAEARSTLSVTNAAATRIIPMNVAAQHIEFDAESPAPAMVVIAQTFYHHWRARVNNRETPILHANYGFQALAIPAGTSHVRLEYVDTGFRLGTILSGVSIAFCAGFWRFAGRKSASV